MGTVTLSHTPLAPHEPPDPPQQVLPGALQL
jgi:hypothetical protein